jgi:hypothetical protein
MYLGLIESKLPDLTRLYALRPALTEKVNKSKYIYVGVRESRHTLLEAEICRTWGALTYGGLPGTGVGWGLCPIDVLYGTCKKDKCTGVHLRATGCITMDGEVQAIARRVVESFDKNHKMYPFWVQLTTAPCIA